MVTRDDVQNAYRLILGREPENPDVLETHLHHNTIQDLRAHFLGSEEFHGQVDQPFAIGRFLDQKKQDIEYECPPETLQRMLARTAELWNQFGDEAPHWSVLVQEDFLPENINQNIDRFYQSGVGNVQICLNALRRAGIPAERFERALDFGCGVGRLSLALAGIADHVTAIDVSAGHLKLARERAATTGTINVDWVQLRDIRELDQFTGYDLVLSLIVLQHNPPPIMAYAFRSLLRALKSGGVAIIQIPTLMAESFSVDDYLAGPTYGMEMHSLPQAVAFKIMDEEGCIPVEVREDMAIGPDGISQNFTILKK